MDYPFHITINHETDSQTPDLQTNALQEEHGQPFYSA